LTQIIGKCQKVSFNLTFKKMATPVDPKKIRILDVLDHIERLNTLIKLHHQETNSLLMVKQYTHLRLRFLNELKTLLYDFELSVEMAT
jgi:hypothetical protein